MAQDLRDLLKEEQKLSDVKMSEGHKTRFLEKLDKALPEQKATKGFNFWSIAASVVILLGLTYGALQFGSDVDPVVPAQAQEEGLKTLGDVSPELKKVEDFYLASINMQLSQIKLTPENKDLFEGYLTKLEELNEEYQNLSKELTDNGPNALTVDAAINNLKLRLSLMMRLQEQINNLEVSEESNTTI